MKSQYQAQKTATMLKDFFDNLRAIEKLFKEVEAMEIKGVVILRVKRRGRSGRER